MFDFKAKKFIHVFIEQCNKKITFPAQKYKKTTFGGLLQKLNNEELEMSFPILAHNTIESFWHHNTVVLAAKTITICNDNHQ